MKILITQRKLKHRGGTEMFSIEISRELRRRGHEVVIFTSEEGDLAMMAHSSGVATTTSLEKLPFIPDLIHGQHHMQFLAALTALPGVPALSYCHGPLWLENPPLHPRIHRYVAMCESMVDRLVTGHGVPREKVRCVGNFFDAQRFSTVSNNRELPNKAILLINTRIPEDKLRIIEKACQKEGYEFTPVGSGYGNATSTPEKLLPQYKVAFVLGRSAIEAMACGCAVIPLNSEKIAPLITINNFEERAYSNFCPRLFEAELPFTVENLREQLRAVKNADIQAVTNKVRNERTIQPSVTKLEQIYQEVLDEARQQPPVSAEEDLKALGVYFSKIIPHLETVNENREKLGMLQYLAQQQVLLSKISTSISAMESGWNNKSETELIAELEKQKSQLIEYHSIFKRLSKTLPGRLFLKLFMKGRSYSTIGNMT